MCRQKEDAVMANVVSLLELRIKQETKIWARLCAHTYTHECTGAR